MTILVTGGAGFIGSHFILRLLENTDEMIVNLDKLNYAANTRNLTAAMGLSNYKFIHGDICNGELLQRLLQCYRPRAIVHFAAESHVDRAISQPADFIQSNIVGTYQLLEQTLSYWKHLNHDRKSLFRFLHISTDEVFGALIVDQPPFGQMHNIMPNNPYSASKAASDHLARAWYKTYGLPIIITHCSNNYGPYQYKEKYIPRLILNALTGQRLPVYGKGLQIRDWIYVEDHCRAIQCILDHGQIGDSYNIGAENEQTNLDVALQLCTLLDEIIPRQDRRPYSSLIEFVPDRPGHDFRYAIDASKLKTELKWLPTETFESGLEKTVLWYVKYYV